MPGWWNCCFYFIFLKCALLQRVNSTLELGRLENGLTLWLLALARGGLSLPSLKAFSLLSPHPLSKRTKEAL